MVIQNFKLYKYKIIDELTCRYRKCTQTVQHNIFDCPLLERKNEKKISSENDRNFDSEL